MAEGKGALKQEREQIRSELAQTADSESREYQTLRARQNIVEQFKHIITRNRVVLTLTGSE